MTTKQRQSAERKIEKFLLKEQQDLINLDLELIVMFEEDNYPYTFNPALLEFSFSKDENNNLTLGFDSYLYELFNPCNAEYPNYKFIERFDKLNLNYEFYSASLIVIYN